jgi:hypothetical protein
MWSLVTQSLSHYVQLPAFNGHFHSRLKKSSIINFPGVISIHNYNN